MGLDWLCRDYLVRELSQIITSFISFEVGVRGMNPNSIKKVYIRAINSYFGSHLIENYFDMASKSFFVKYVMRGFLKIHHLIHPKGEAKKLAFTVELVQYVDAAVVGKKLKGKDNAIFMRAIKLAMKFGIYFLMRKSEFLPGRSSGGAVDRKGLPFRWLQFASKDGHTIEWDNIKIKKAQSVSINITKSKMDQFGKGRIVRHNRVAGENCIVKELEDWVTWCRDHINQSGHLAQH